MNKGKRFEQNFRKSVPNDMFYYRLKDSTNSWSNGDVRFTPHNMCDAILYDGNKLYLLELKNHKGKSLPLSCIRKNQLEELALNGLYKNVKSYLVINFEDVEECYCLNISDITDFIRKSDRKSIPIQYCQEKGIKIEMKRLRTNYKYNINNLLSL